MDPTSLGATTTKSGRRRKDLNMKIVKSQVRLSDGGSGALYVIPVKLLAHETQTTTMAMCLSTAEKTTMAECLSANTNNNGNVFICSRGNWSGLQRKLANCNKVRVRQFSKIRIWTTFNICIVFVSHPPRFGPLSLTTAQRQGEVFNNLGFTSTQPTSIFSSSTTSRSWEKWYK